MSSDQPTSSPVPAEASPAPSAKPEQVPAGAAIESPSSDASPSSEPAEPPAGQSSATGVASEPPRALAGAQTVSAQQPGPGYLFLVIVTAVNLVADLWSKHWATSHFQNLRPGQPRRVVVIEDVMNFIFAKNKGGAWGLLQSEGELVRRAFFLTVSVAAIVFIVSLYRKLRPDQIALKWGLPLVLGGAMGNLVDRIRYGWVVDFIDVYGKFSGDIKHWPTFNVADISICVGVGLMAIDMFTARTPEPVSELKAPPKQGGGGASSTTEKDSVSSATEGG